MVSSLVIVATALLICFNSTSAAEKVEWWESTTLYQIYPSSFMDTNGDGWGDLRGIITKLKYLRDIGVKVVWISPFYRSPMVDVGYDISNFTDVDPLFGTMADFDEMLKKAHKLGLKIVLDFVPNHSSVEHEWFKKSVRREKGYEDYYVWADAKYDPVTGERMPPNNWRSVFTLDAWAWNEERQQYYLHDFTVKQAEFNLRNPAVRQRLIEILEFWFDRGIDGFRIDAVPFLYEYQLENGTYPDLPYNSTMYQFDRPENLQLVYEWRAFLDKYQKAHGGDTRIFIGEAYSPIDVLSASISNGTNNGLHMPMNLEFVKIDGNTSATIIEEAVNAWMSDIWVNHRQSNWVSSNHDRRRLANRMGFNRLDLMTMIIHALPGTSITYYGDEIGMTDGEFDCSDDSCDARFPQRTPMQWDTTKNAGFSTGNLTWLPVNQNYEIINQKAACKTSRSTLQIFKEMAKLKATAAFRAFKEEGAFSYAALSEQVFQIVRTDKVTEEYRLLANFGNQLEHVEGLTNKTMEYVVLNKYSTHNKGEKIDLSKRVYLLPYEAVVLRWTAGNKSK